MYRLAWLLVCVGCAGMEEAKPPMFGSEVGSEMDWSEPRLEANPRTTVSLDGADLSVATLDCEVSDVDEVFCATTITLTLPESVGPLDLFFVTARTADESLWCPDLLHGGCLTLDMPLWPIRSESGKLRHAFVEALPGVYVSSVDVRFTIGEDMAAAFDASGGSGTVFAEVVVGSPTEGEPALVSQPVELFVDRPCSETPDCAGVCLGTATTDMCGTCDADPSNDCAMDCTGSWGGTASFDMCGTCDADPSNDCVMDCAGMWGGLAEVDACGDCYSPTDSGGFVDSFDSFDSSLWAYRPPNYTYAGGSMFVTGDSSDVMRTAEPMPLRDVFATLNKEDACSDHIIMISPRSDAVWTWASSPDVLRLGWNCTQKVLYYADGSEFTPCSDDGRYDIAISMDDDSVTFTDDRCAPLTAPVTFADEDVYLYVGADCDDCVSEWLGIETYTGDAACLEDCSGTPGGEATVDMCGTCDDDPSNDCELDCAGVWGGDSVIDSCGDCMAESEVSGFTDEFYGWDASRWTAPPSRYEISGGRLKVSGDAPSSEVPMRTLEPDHVLSISGTVERDDRCADHFIMLSPDPSATWSWAPGEQMHIAYNCTQMEIVGGGTVARQVCDVYGARDFTLSLTPEGVTFDDPACAPLTLPQDWTTEPLYVYVGADNDAGVSEWERLAVEYDPTIMVDDFDFFDASIWFEQPSRYSYVSGELRVSGTAEDHAVTPHMRTKTPLKLGTVTATLNKDDACSDHFVMFSRDDDADWAWSGMESGTVRLAWNCNQKTIFGQMETITVDCPDGIGVNSLRIDVTEDVLVFADDRCPTLVASDTIGREDELYVYVGGDQDTTGRYTRWLDFEIDGTLECVSE